MIPALTEGIASVALPCSLALLIPGVAALMAGKSAGWVGLGFMPSVVIAMWVRAVTGLGLAGGWWIGAGLLLAAAFLAVWARPHALVQIGAGGLIAMVAVSTWEPCVF